MQTPIKLLCIDDEISILRAYERVFRDKTVYSVLTLSSPEALDYEIAMNMDVIICDQRMPKILGTEVFHRLNSMGFQGTKIISSGFADFDDIISAFNDQAINHFINKPWDNLQLRNLVNSTQHKEPPASQNYGDAMEHAYSQAQKASRSDVAVYIQGETGSGKEVMTQFIHQSSPRKDGPLVTVNCATLTPDLFESLMFGHKKGAFTGAVRDHKGFFEAADGGTLFLDEVVDIPPTAQAKILRALQEHTITPLGDTEDIHVDVRVISASARPIEQSVNEGTFRNDLMYRLNVFPISIPPLRERPNEILSLFETFLQRFNIHNDWPAISYDESVTHALLNYPWPGNIRELNNLCNYLCASLDQPNISVNDIPEHYRNPNAKETEVTRPDNATEIESILSVEEALKRCGNNKSQAAKLLGISRMTLWRKLQSK